ncbi:31193_t:CDS:2 [Gigaspora margarita]|uniref:31193_t:CDS:1 n=1 Tax=Gigaspora margarita TaxID=4874 RepID=A0ABN7UR09_GIGMA|nr:31193_t:CDS:2 [Gigaspora margarita]
MKCSGSEIAPCKNCVKHNRECIFTDSIRKRGPKPNRPNYQLGNNYSLYLLNKEVYGIKFYQNECVGMTDLNLKSEFKAFNIKELNYSLLNDHKKKEINLGTEFKTSNIKEFDYSLFDDQKKVGNGEFSIPEKRPKLDRILNDLDILFAEKSCYFDHQITMHSTQSTQTTPHSDTSFKLIDEQYNNNNKDIKPSSVSRFLETKQSISKAEHDNTYRFYSPSVLEFCGPKRRHGNLPKATTTLLKDWLARHKKHPYPTEEEKQVLARKTMLTLQQISNWFINARRRFLPPIFYAQNSESFCNDLDIYPYKVAGKIDGGTSDIKSTKRHTAKAYTRLQVNGAIKKPKLTPYRGIKTL